MAYMLSTLDILADAGSLTCCIIMWIKMFRQGENTTAMVYIASAAVVGLGLLLTWFWGVRMASRRGPSKSGEA